MKYSTKVAIDGAVQVPVILLVGIPGNTGNQAGGEEESEFLDGRIHDQSIKERFS